jgi:hypothetical protein
VLIFNGCGTWFLILRKERRLGVPENRVLRIISEPKRGEVTGGCRKMCDEELRILYSSPKTITQSMIK